MIAFLAFFLIAHALSSTFAPATSRYTTRQIIYSTTATFSSDEFYHISSYDKGGALYASYSTNLTCLHCEFSNCSAYYSSDSGGAIYVGSLCSLNLTNTKFEGCSAGYYGGAVYVDGKLSISGCNFYESSSSCGGHIFMDDITSYSDIRSTSFISGKANGSSTSQFGGAITARSVKSNITISDCTFSYNTASLGGGAIYFAYTSSYSINYKTLYFSSNTFTGNGFTSYSYGGSDIEFDSSWACKVSSSAFSNCTSTSPTYQIYISTLGDRSNYFSGYDYPGDYNCRTNPSYGGLAGWIIAVIALGVFVTLGIPLLICCCFCCACGCFAHRATQSHSTTVYQTAPAAPTAVVIAGPHMHPQGYAQPPQGYAQPPQGYAQPPQGYAQPPSYAYSSAPPPPYQAGAPPPQYGQPTLYAPQQPGYYGQAPAHLPPQISYDAAGEKM